MIQTPQVTRMRILSPLSNTTFVFNGIVHPKLTFPTFATRTWCCWRLERHFLFHINFLALQGGKDLYLMEAFPDQGQVHLLLKLLLKLVREYFFGWKNGVKLVILRQTGTDRDISFCIFLLKFLKCQFAWENINFEWAKPLLTWPQQQQTCKTLTQNHQPGRTNCVLWACCLQRCPARTQHPSRWLQGVWKH